MKHEAIRRAFEREQKKAEEPPEKKANIGGRRPKDKPPVHKQGAGVNNKYLTYEQAKLFCAQAEYITSSTEYKDWIKIKGYKFLPLTPTYVYKREWEGWPVYLGARAPKTVKRLPYYEAKSIVQKLAVKYDLTDGDCYKNWINFCDDQYILDDADRELPEGIPRHPFSYYKEWEGWPAFMGKGLKSKLENAKQKAQLIEEAKNEGITQYNGQPVYAITTGVDPMNSNVIKVIVEYTGLSQLIATCNNLQYDILAVFIFDKKQLPMILDNLNTYGTDRGNSCFVMNDMTAMLAGLEFDTVLVPKHLYL